MAQSPKAHTRADEPPAASSPYLKLDQVAQALQCSRRHVDRLIANGELVATSFGPRSPRVHRSDLEAFCALRRSVTL